MYVTHEYLSIIILEYKSVLTLVSSYKRKLQNNQLGTVLFYVYEIILLKCFSFL